jgi:uncharacterized tellurite resistance protein B-like protein
MVATASPSYHTALDYSFLLLTHLICADQQVHSQESRSLRELATQAQVNEATLQEMEKILGQDDSQISLKAATDNVPIGQRSETLRQVMAIAYIDGYFSPLEREMVNLIAQAWSIHEQEIEQMLEDAQGFGQWQIPASEVDESLSIGATLLRGAESVLSRSLVTRLCRKNFLRPNNRYRLHSLKQQFQILLQSTWLERHYPFVQFLSLALCQSCSSPRFRSTFFSRY